MGAAGRAGARRLAGGVVGAWRRGGGPRSTVRRRIGSVGRPPSSGTRFPAGCRPSAFVRPDVRGRDVAPGGVVAGPAPRDGAGAAAGGAVTGGVAAVAGGGDCGRRTGVPPCGAGYGRPAGAAGCGPPGRVSAPVAGAVASDDAETVPPDRPGGVATVGGVGGSDAVREPAGGPADRRGRSGGAGAVTGRARIRGRFCGASGAPRPTRGPGGESGREPGGACRDPGGASGLTGRRGSEVGPGRRASVSVGPASAGVARRIGPPGRGPGRAAGPSAGTTGPPRSPAGVAGARGPAGGVPPGRGVPGAPAADERRCGAATDRCTGGTAPPDGPAPGPVRPGPGIGRIGAGRGPGAAGASGAGAGRTMGSPRPSRGGVTPVRWVRDAGAGLADAPGSRPRTVGSPPGGATGATTVGGGVVAAGSPGGATAGDGVGVVARPLPGAVPGEASTRAGPARTAVRGDRETSAGSRAGSGRAGTATRAIVNGVPDRRAGAGRTGWGAVPACGVVDGPLGRVGPVSAAGSPSGVDGVPGTAEIAGGGSASADPAPVGRRTGRSRRAAAATRGETGRSRSYASPPGASRVTRCPSGFWRAGLCQVASCRRNPIGSVSGTGAVATSPAIGGRLRQPGSVRSRCGSGGEPAVAPADGPAGPAGRRRRRSRSRTPIGDHRPSLTRVLMAAISAT